MTTLFQENLIKKGVPTSLIDSITEISKYLAEKGNEDQVEKAEQMKDELEPSDKLWNKLMKKCLSRETKPRAQNAYQAFLADTTCRDKAEKSLKKKIPNYTREQYLSLMSKELGDMWTKIKTNPNKFKIYQDIAKKTNKARGFDTSSESEHISKKTRKSKSKGKGSKSKKKKVVVVESDSSDSDNSLSESD